MGLSQLNYLYSKGKLKDALDHLEEIESHYQPTHPDFFEIKLIKARILLETGEYEEGEKMLNSLLDLGRKGGKLMRLDMVILLTDFLWRKGDWEQSYFLQEMGEYDLFKLGTEVPQDEKDKRYAELKRLRGIYARYTGELDTAMEYFSHCLYSAEKTEDDRLLAKIYYLLGVVHRESGELTKAWTFFSNSISLRQKFHDEINGAVSQYQLAALKESLGDFQGAYEDYKEIYRISDRLENHALKAMSISGMGIVNLKRGNYGIGMELVTTGLEMKSERKDIFDLSWSLYQLLKILLQSEQSHLAPIFMDELEKLYNENGQHPLIIQHYRMISGFNLMYSDKTIDKAKAQQLFKEVMNDRVIHVDLNIAAMITYTEMLLDELSAIPDQEIVNELSVLFEKLNDVVDDQQSIPLTIEVNLLKTRLAILKLDYHHGLALITAISKEIEDHKIKYLEHKMLQLHNSLILRVEEITGFNEDDISVIHQVEKSQLEEEVASLISKNRLTVDREASIPVLFMITDQNDNLVLKVELADDHTIDDVMVQKMINALSMVFRTQLSPTGIVERVKHGEYTVLSRNLDQYFCNLVIKGSGDKEMIKLMDRTIQTIASRSELLEALQDIDVATSTTILGIIKHMMAQT